MSTKEKDTPEPDPSLPPPAALPTTNAPSFMRMRPSVRSKKVLSPWKYPQAAVAREVLRTLMRSGPDALFERWPPDSASGAEGPRLGSEPDAPYRATAFWPVSIGGKKRLYPFLRARLGSSVSECTSALYFKKGEAFAGDSWAQGDEPLVRDELPSLEDLDGNEALWRETWRQLRVPKRIAMRMGRDTAYAKRVRSLACIAVESAYGPIVFCIDSLRKNAFDDSMLSKCAIDKYKNIEGLLQAIPALVSDQRDFWTWAISAYKKFGTVVVALAALWSMVSKLASLLPSSAPVLASLPPPAVVAAWSLAAMFLFLGFFGFVPEYKSIPQDSPNAPRVVAFVERWHRSWWFIFLAHAAFALSVTIEPSDFSTVVSVAAPLFLIAAASLVLGCCFCLVRFSPDKLSLDKLVSVPLPVLALATVLALVAVIFHGNVFLLYCPAAIMLATALGLLAGRLDSRLIGVPGPIIAAIYLNVVLIPFSCLLVALSQSDAGSAELLKSSHLRLVTVLAMVVRVPLDLILFVVVLWCVRGRALERYLSNIEDIAVGVPRRSFRTALQMFKKVSGAAAD